MRTTKLTAENHRSFGSTATLGCALVSPGTAATVWRFGPPQNRLEGSPPEETSCSVVPQALSTPLLLTLNCQLLGPSLPGLTSLPLDAHTLPKRDAILDLRRRGLRVWVVPRRVVIPHSAHFHAVVVRRALPRALGGVRARFQKFRLDRIHREI